MTIEEVIRVLLNYESNGTKPIVVTGPDFTQKNKLRVYLNGGLIGKISVGKGKNDLLSSDYKNYANGYADDLKPKKGKDTLDTLVSTEYLNAAAFATNNRFMKSNSNSEAEKETSKHKSLQNICTIQEVTGESLIWKFNVLKNG